MVNDEFSLHALSSEARSAIWRIFGNGESPLSHESTYDLIEPIVRKRVPPLGQNRAISEIRGWFGFQSNEPRLREDMYKPVGVLILSSIKDALSPPNGIDEGEIALWAVGSIEADFANQVIRSTWSSDEIDLFVSCMLKALSALCKKDAILDARRIWGLDADNAKASMKEVPYQRMLETFRDQNDNFWYLYSGVRSVIELLVKLSPDQFHELVARAEHPVVQAFAVRCKIDASAASDHCEPLQWITEQSCDALVALAIVHTLNNVNSMESELLRGTEPGRTLDEVERAITSLLLALVNRLAVLSPITCAGWVAQLLRHGASALTPRSQSEKPRRLEQLEEACVQLLARLVRQSWSGELSAELRSGLCLTPLTPRVLPLAEVAWELRESQPERAADISQLVLETHEQQISEILVGNRSPFYGETSWRDRDWLIGLGIALALSCDDLDPLRWVLEKCRALPLSAWDAEENPEGFRIANKVAQFRFLVVFYAVQVMRETGCVVDPVKIRTLAEKLWVHCHFAEIHGGGQLEESTASVFAARVAIELAKPDDAWILDQIRKPEVDPLTLWALIDQRMKVKAQSNGSDPQHEEFFLSELRSVVLDRFNNVNRFGLVELHQLGNLWLLLDAAEQAENTAMVIIASHKPDHLKRFYKILALKLLAFSARRQQSSPWIGNEIAVLYNQLWSSYTPSDEREFREEIEKLLK